MSPSPKSQPQAKKNYGEREQEGQHGGRQVHQIGMSGPTEPTSDLGVLDRQEKLSAFSAVW